MIEKSNNRMKKMSDQKVSVDKMKIRSPEERYNDELNRHWAQSQTTGKSFGSGAWIETVKNLVTYTKTIGGDVNFFLDLVAYSFNQYQGKFEDGEKELLLRNNYLKNLAKKWFSGSEQPVAAVVAVPKVINVPKPDVEKQIDKAISQLGALFGDTPTSGSARLVEAGLGGLLDLLSAPQKK